jgi:heptosyltransferase-3
MFKTAYQISDYGNYPDLTGVKKILIIKLRHLGDVLLASPVFSILKNNFPSSTIDAFIYDDAQSILEDNPNINKCITVKREETSFFKKVARDFVVYKKIFNENYDLVINLTEGDRGALAAFFSGAPTKVGFIDSNKGFLGKNHVFNYHVKMCMKGRHTVEKNLDALRKIGIFPSIQERKLSFFIPEYAKKKVDLLLEDKKINAKSFFIVHPASRWKFKCLNSSLVAKIIDGIKSKGMEVIVCASSDPFEISMVNDIINRCKSNPHNFANHLSIKEFAALLDKSNGLLCVDSLPLHLSSALKKPVIALFGPTCEKIWGPWQNSNAHVISHELPCRPCFLDGCGGSKKSDCLEQISFLKVMNAIAKIGI